MSSQALSISPPTIEDRQVALERESRDLGVVRYQKSQPMPWRNEHSKSRQESDTRPGKEMVKRVLKDYIANLEEMVARYREGRGGRGKPSAAVVYLQHFALDEVAFIAARRIINGASDRDSLTGTAMSVATLLEDHYEFSQFAKSDPGLYRQQAKKLKRVLHYGHRRGILKKHMKHSKGAIEGKIKSLAWSPRDKCLLGTALIQRFVEQTGLVEIITVNRAQQTQYRLQFTPKARGWLDGQHRNCALWSPVLLPMVARPLDWSNVRDGGYYIHRAWLMTGAGRRYLEDLENVEMPAVYAAINAIQSTPWRISRGVLSVAREAFERNMAIAGLPTKEREEIPPRPADIPEKVKFSNLPTEQQARLRAWIALAARVHERNASATGQRLTVLQQMWVADRFESEPEIYFPHQLDFRGRIYPIPPLVNPQGDDLGRSLIEFSRGKPLGEFGGYWLAVHLANCFGFDKVSFDERVEWAKQNSGAILDSAMRPLDGEQFWLKADAPWQFLSACFEWAGFMIQGDDYVSHIPIHMDGTCSGLQHYSALLLDPVGGAAVNLIPSPTKQDVYQIVADKTERALGNDETAIAKAWRGKVVRKLVKQPTMTFAYSATSRGMRDQIVSAVEGLGGERYIGDTKLFEAATYLAPIVRDAIRETVIAASSAMDWLQSVATEKAQNNERLLWTAPSGLPIRLDCRKLTGQSVRVTSAGKTLQLRLEIETGNVDSRKQSFGIAPNFIHGMDASHLMFTVLRSVDSGIADFAMIHDSFGTHAADVSELHVHIREAFIEMYRSNWLAEFAKEVSAKAPPPPKGDLDVEQVRGSDFFFA